MVIPHAMRLWPDDRGGWQKAVSVLRGDVATLLFSQFHRDAFKAGAGHPSLVDSCLQRLAALRLFDVACFCSEKG